MERKRWEFHIYCPTQLDEDERRLFGAVVGGLIGYGAADEEVARIGVEANGLKSVVKTVEIEYGG